MTEDNTQTDGAKYNIDESRFTQAVFYELAERGDWGVIEYACKYPEENGRGPEVVARALALEPNAKNRDSVTKAADELTKRHDEVAKNLPSIIQFGPKTGGSSGEEPDDSFGLAVVRELASRGEWGAIHCTTDNARDMSGLGPVAVAKELDLEPNASDKDAVTEVADAVVDWFYDTGSGEYYGPESDDGDDDGDEPDARSYRKNDGKWDDDHRIFLEMDRLADEGARISSWTIVETDVDHHPDYLQVEYHGVSADTMEDLRYRHIRHTDYGALASRPLSEIEKYER